MARRIEGMMLAGPAGHLEALLEEPEDREPQFAALVCHPHPLHGGTMHNKVVYRLARGLRKARGVVLRFNFRGVNLSEGQHAGGIGEVDDARAALAELRGRYPELPWLLSGFSFGSRVALRLGCGLGGDTPRKVLALGFPTIYPDFGFVENCRLPRVFIHSTSDEFGPKDTFQAFYSRLFEPKKLVWVPAQDHFFAGALDSLEEAVTAEGALT